MFALLYLIPVIAMFFIVLSHWEFDENDRQHPFIAVIVIGGACFLWPITIVCLFNYDKVGPWLDRKIEELKEEDKEN